MEILERKDYEKFAKYAETLHFKMHLESLIVQLIVNQQPHFLSLIRWKPIDGQHVVKSCEDSMIKYEWGEMSWLEYEKTFKNKEATIVLYNIRVKLWLATSFNKE